VVSNLRSLDGIVSLEANSETSELIVRFNADILTLEELVSQVGTTGDEVSAWEMKE
jgi:hypothetical protein